MEWLHLVRSERLAVLDRRRCSHTMSRACTRRGEHRRTMPDAWVYLLRCRDGSLHTGWTVDLERRLARHQSGVASRYTASRLPVELALAIPMTDRKAARCEEARIKRKRRPAKLALLSSQTPP
jgi:putative endonuclease